RAACAQLVKTALVRRAATSAGLWPDPAQLKARWDELRAQMKAAGRDPDKEPLLRNCPESVLLDYLAVDLAHEQLVRRELALGTKEQVSPAMLELWVKEARESASVVDDPDQLPIGTAANVADRGLPLLDLGMLLLRSSDQAELDKFVRQVVVLDGIEDAARRDGIEALPEDLRMELDMRRTMADRDPRFGGLSFEQLLRAQGLTPDWLLQSRVFRAQCLQKKLIAKRNPRTQLMARLASDRAGELEKFGARRRLAIVFARALDEPNAIVPRDFDQAMAHLATVRERLDSESFENVARIESDDPGTKMRGGDCGWLQRRSRDLPELVLAAAFALADGSVSEPIRADDGCYLVKVLGIEPALDDDAVIARMREQLVEDFTRDLLKNAKIRRSDGTSMDGEETAK
ncbi:MAG: peptidylprolyl isomerase, partial [Planctomycetota bacterium]